MTNSLKKYCGRFQEIIGYVENKHILEQKKPDFLTNYTVKQDVLSPTNTGMRNVVTKKNMNIQSVEPESIVPQPPVKYNKTENVNDQKWYLTYKSELGEKKLCKDEDCECVKNEGGWYYIICRGKIGYNKLLKIYQEEQQGISDKSVRQSAHEVLPWLSAASLFIPIPYVNLIVSSGLNFLDAELYRREGEYYTAGLFVFFSIIPFSTLSLKIPIIRKFGLNSWLKLMDKLKKYSNPKLDSHEIELLKELKKDEKLIRKVINDFMIKRFIGIIVWKYGVRPIITGYLIWAKFNPYKRMALELGGVLYSYDKLAKMYGIEDKSTKNITDINKVESTIKEEDLVDIFEINEYDLELAKSIYKETEKK